LILERSESYIGTLIDDLVAKGTNEPYRMFTARSEYRLLLREDNADLRLTKKGRDIGLVSDAEYERVQKKARQVGEIKEKLDSFHVGPGNPRVNEILEKRGESLIHDGISLASLLRRANVDFNDVKYVAELIPGAGLAGYEEEIEYQAEVQVKYAGYIERALQMIEAHRGFERKKIPADLDYAEVGNIPREARDKLSRARPLTIGQAARISGVSPADIQALLVALRLRGD